MEEDYDYTSSGFDGFLSRSIDDLSQFSLASPGPVSTAIRYDSSQQSGQQGDSYTMGGISMSAKDSTITVNDGQLLINDTNTNSSIIGSSGNISYNDNTGRPVVQEGLLSNNTTGIIIIDTNGRTVAQFGRQLDGSTNLKFFDKSGVGLAQFGEFADGSTALKVSSAGIDVSSATDAQLIFDSSRDMLKVEMTNTATIALGLGAGTPGISTSTITIPHNLGYIPGVIAFLSIDNDFTSTGTITPSYTPGRFMLLPDTLHHITSIASSTTTVLEPAFLSNAQVDTSNLYLNTALRWLTTTTTYNFTYKYYILAESVSSS